MSAAQLLSDFAQLGICLEVHGDRLRYSPRSAVTPELHHRLKANKQELLVMLEASSKVKNVHFKSSRDDWETPQALFDKLNTEFEFDLDVCASSENTKCARYFSRETDGLSQEWSEICWMNPPYGREIGKWMSKAYESSQEGATIVCLVPARTDTKWWHEYATRGEIRFLRGRLKFGDASSSAPFPSAIVIFRPPADANSSLWESTPPDGQDETEAPKAACNHNAPKTWTHRDGAAYCRGCGRWMGRL